MNKMIRFQKMNGEIITINSIIVRDMILQLQETAVPLSDRYLDASENLEGALEKAKLNCQLNKIYEHAQMLSFFKPGNSEYVSKEVQNTLKDLFQIANSGVNLEQVPFVLNEVVIAYIFSDFARYDLIGYIDTSEFEKIVHQKTTNLLKKI